MNDSCFNLVELCRVVCMCVCVCADSVWASKWDHAVKALNNYGKVSIRMQNNYNLLKVTLANKKDRKKMGPHHHTYPKQIMQLNGIKGQRRVLEY